MCTYAWKINSDKYKNKKNTTYTVRLTVVGLRVKNEGWGVFGY